MKLDYVFDLHTASAGRQNSLYVRADMNDDNIKKLATDLSPQIIVHNSSPGGSLRGCAQQNGIKALTVEVCFGYLLISTMHLITMYQIGNPSTFQHNLITRTVNGICNALTFQLGYPPLSNQYAIQMQQQSPVICCRSVSLELFSF
jgi:predicted deacylase